MVAACVAAFGSLDYAVNNAGTTGAGGFTADYDVDDWHRTITLNLDSVFYCLKAEIPVMLAQGGGAIVNVASGAGLVGFAGLPAYVASKHGVVGLTRASALEYAAQGIRINCVCPGSTRTPMLEGFMGGDEKVEKMMRNAVPMRRLGRPEEIAAAIVWLCSDAASFVVGHAHGRRRRLRHPIATRSRHAQRALSPFSVPRRSDDAGPELPLVAHRVVEHLGRGVEALGRPAVEVVGGPTRITRAGERDPRRVHHVGDALALGPVAGELGEPAAGRARPT